jgi:hypothetical protein
MHLDKEFFERATMIRDDEHLAALKAVILSVPSAVDIPMTGQNRTDFGLADEAMQARVPGWERPSGHTWHHHKDGVTMQLLPQNVHATGGGAGSPHMGGASLYRGQQSEGCLRHGRYFNLPSC